MQDRLQDQREDPRTIHMGPSRLQWRKMVLQHGMRGLGNGTSDRDGMVFNSQPSR